MWGWFFLPTKVERGHGLIFKITLSDYSSDQKLLFGGTPSSVLTPLLCLPIRNHDGEDSK